MAKEAFAVIREGMKGKAGIGKVALYGREYLVKVQPREQGLIMYTLRHANEIRSMDAIDELGDMPATLKPAEVKLAQQVIGTFEGDVDFAEYRDDYQVGLREIIDAKIEGREIVAQEEEAPQKVVNLMDALRKSLDSISASKKKPDRDARSTRAAARAETIADRLKKLESFHVGRSVRFAMRTTRLPIDVDVGAGRGVIDRLIQIVRRRVVALGRPFARDLGLRRVFVVADLHRQRRDARLRRSCT